MRIRPRVDQEPSDYVTGSEVYPAVVHVSLQGTQENLAATGLMEMMVDQRTRT